MSRIVDENGYQLNEDQQEECETTKDVSNMDSYEEILTDLDTAIVLTIPANTTKMNIEVEMINENNDIIKCTRTMFLPEIVESRIEGSYWADENVKYKINPDCVKNI